jgi:PAS domain S-box-containing protein
VVIATPRLADWPARILVVAGFGLVLYGGETLLEWHTGATLLPDWPFLPYRAHYDTAWAFVLIGLALFAIIGGSTAAVATCAIAVMLIGAARWLEELFPALEIPTRPLLGGLLPRLQLDDISPPSALGLILGAAVLLALKQPPYSAGRSVLAAMLAFSLAALATFLLAGPQTSGPFLYGWLQLDSNDGANAVGFMLLAAAVLFFIFFGDGPEATAARRWASLAVWLAVVLASVGLWQALRLQQARETVARTHFVAGAIRIELTSKLHDRLRLLQRAAERGSAAAEPGARLRAEAPQLLNDVPEFRAIAWADAGLTVRWTVPEGGRARGMNLFGDDRRKWAAAAALSGNGPVFTESMEIQPGQGGFEIYVSVSGGDQFHGILIGTVMHAGWLESLLADRFTQYSIVVREHGQPIGQARLKERAASPEWSHEQPLSMQNVAWTLEVAPTQSTLEAADTVLPQATLTIGVLLATLLAFTMFLFQTALRRARGAASANRLLALDIEARKQAEQALRESEQETRHVIEDARDFYFRLFSDFPNLVWRADAVGKCDYCNQNWLEFTGRTLEQELGDGWLQGLHPEDRPAWAEAFDAALRDNQPFEIQLRLRRRNGQYGSLICSCKPYHNMRGELAGFLCSCYDDTARREMQAELRASRERMRSFSRHLQTAREEEKNRIARDLHDELGATLTALRMDSSWLARRIPEADGAAAQKTRGIVQLADSAIQFIRRTITELRPSILDNLGLVAALRWQAKEFQARSGIAVKVEVSHDDIVVDKEHAIVFFRIFQETLTNVLKHAQAHQVTVRFAATEDSHVLEVKDDGIGMPPDWGMKESSHGILGMQERAREFNGDLDIASAASGGTTVTVTLPRANQAAMVEDLSR